MFPYTLVDLRSLLSFLNKQVVDLIKGYKRFLQTHPLYSIKC